MFLNGLFSNNICVLGNDKHHNMFFHNKNIYEYINKKNNKFIILNYKKEGKYREIYNEELPKLDNFIGYDKKLFLIYLIFNNLSTNLPPKNEFI